MNTEQETQQSARSAKAGKKQSTTWSAEEQAAMKARAKELKAEARASKNKAEGEKVLLAAIAEMAEPDHSIATELHRIVTANAPMLSPKTWYGMPAYANQEGKVVCFFQAAQKFGTRYSTFGFNDTANLDDGEMWPTGFALKELTPAAEARISALVRQAVS